MSNLRRNKFIVSLIMVVLMAVGVFGYKAYQKHQYNEGLKEITVELDAGDFSKIKSYKTDKDTLSEFIKDMGEDAVHTDTGFMMITGLYGFEANMDNQEWLKLYVNGVVSEVGADQVILEDGQEIEFELTIGW